MTTISLKIPATLAARLATEATACRKPKSVLIRDYIERGLAATSKRPPTFHDLARDKCGIGRSGCQDLASNPKHLEDYGR